MATGHQTNQPVSARVNRAFWYEGKVYEVGSKLALPPAVASELYAAGKIERADLEPSPMHKQALLEVKAKAERKASAIKAAAKAPV